MEVFFVIAVGVVLVLMINSFRQEVKKNMRIMNKNIINVRKEMADVKESVQGKNVVLGTTKVEAKETVIEASSAETETDKKSTRLVKPLIQEPKVEKPQTLKPEEKEKIAPVLKKEDKPVVQKATVQPIKTAPQSKPANRPIIASKKSVQKRDYEKIIGENWLNKIGIAILVIGVGFFVKYAIDKNWIGEVGRVGIGVGIGAAMMGIAHFLRKKYRAFSSVLIGGGISVLYYTISIAYHDYQIFSQPVAFGIMTFITILSTLLAVLYDRKELAIIALIGGFTSPFMVQGETGNYVAFFTYIAILNAGMLFLSFFKKWSIVSQLALGFTVLFFGSWMIIENMHDSIRGGYAMLFGTIFFVQFLGANLGHNLIRKLTFNAWEFIQLSSITAFYYGGMMYLLNVINTPLSPSAFTLILSGFFTLLTLISYSVKGTDKALIHLLIGKAIAFTTLSGALLFEGNHMTEYWIIESVVLLLVGIRGKMKILTTTSFILVLLATVGLIRDWAIGYGFSPSYVPFWNSIFATGIFYLAGVLTSFIVISRSKVEENLFPIPKNDYSTILGALLFGGTYFVFLLEIAFQMDNILFEPGKHMVLWLYHFALVLAAQFIARHRKSELFKIIMFFMGCVATAVYLILGQYNNYQILKHVTTVDTQQLFYGLHYLLVSAVIGVLIMCRHFAKTIISDVKNRNYFHAAIWIVGLVIATNELDQIMGFMFSSSYGLSKVLSHTQTEGYTVLWGIYSFIVMIIGMKRKNKVMRILALILFAVTLIKLFAVDIQEISEAGKIIAFISLGVLLLVISFMYQKLKQLIIGEEETEPQLKINQSEDLSKE